MNLQILSAEIVRRVKGSPDSAVNLETVVANLIRAEQSRSLKAIEGDLEADVLEAKLRRDFGLDFRAK